MLSFGVREMGAALRVLARGELARYGTTSTSEVARLEDETRRLIGVEHALAVNSGTSALICGLVGTGVGPGDEVLVPAYTWVATAAAVLAVGAVPVLAEVDDSLTIDPVDVKRKITTHTKAIIPVHMMNLVSDMNLIMAIAQEYNLVVIEDACQAVGVSYRGRRAGSIGHAGAFSFNQQKNIKSGEGGCVLTNDPRTSIRAGMYHDVGSYVRPGWTGADEPLFVGVNYRMPELSAAILRPQLRRLDQQLALRRKRRQMAIDAIYSSPFCNFSLVPHHDQESAVGLAVRFEDPDEARSFACHRGVSRLIDTGRHVYTNWQSVIAKRSYHKDINPHRWAHREIDYSASACPETLSILKRTCAIHVASDLPWPAFLLWLRQFGQRPFVRASEL